MVSQVQKPRRFFSTLFLFLSVAVASFESCSAQSQPDILVNRTSLNLLDLKADTPWHDTLMARLSHQPIKNKVLALDQFYGNVDDLLASESAVVSGLFLLAGKYPQVGERGDLVWVIHRINLQDINLGLPSISGELWINANGKHKHWTFGQKSPETGGDHVEK